MKKWILVFVIILLFTSIAACFPAELASTPGTTGTPEVSDPTTTVTTFGTTVSTATTVGSTPPTSSAPPLTEPTTLPTTAPTTGATAPTTTPPTTTQPVAPTTRPIVTTKPTVSTTTPTVTTEPSVPTTGPTEPAPSKPVGYIGWKQEKGKWYYYIAPGQLAVGFTQVGGSQYYFDPDGAMHTGWLDLEDDRYYFSPGGLKQTGWILVEGNRYYLDQEGRMQTGWLDLDNKRYYLGDDGVMHVGWLMQNANAYYLQENGIMARGMVLINGEKNYFTSTGVYIMLVNPWNYMPEGYEPELVTLDRHKHNVQQVDARCYAELMQMLDDCKKQCQSAVVLSSYRTHEFQTYNYNRKVNYYLNRGYSQKEAERLAAQVVAVPGTSEHQLGLAVDIVDNRNWNLDESQAEMPAQKWLMANSWKYGFILRYPVGKTAVTGIIYEPWHYRYVGKELAKELHECGLTLEEYMDKLTKEAST